MAKIKTWQAAGAALAAVTLLALAACSDPGATAATAPSSASTASAAGKTFNLAPEGRFDPVRVRERFLNGFQPEHTFVVEVAGQNAGVIAVRPEPDAQWIEHFYLSPEHQGKGLGGAVLREVMDRPRDHRSFRLNVLKGSADRRLYERHGFAVESEDAVDVFMVAPVS